MHALLGHPRPSVAPLRLLSALAVALVVLGLTVSTALPAGPPEPATAEAALAELRRQSPDRLRVEYDADTGLPGLLAGRFAPPDKSDVPAAARSFLKSNRALYQFDDVNTDLELTRVGRDELGMSHARFRQKFKGLEVVGSELIVHLDEANDVSSVNGRFLPKLKLSNHPIVSRESGVNTAVTNLHGQGVLVDDARTDLVVYNHTPYDTTAQHGKDKARIIKHAEGAYLAWRVVLHAQEPAGTWVYFVDGASGDVLSRYNDEKDALNRLTYTANNGPTLPGTLLISEGGSSSDPVAQAAHNNMGTTYRYYNQVHGRDSYDHMGATLISSVHYNSAYNNARWNGIEFLFGDGDGVSFAPFGNALDIVTHEFTHAVIDRTAGLIYQYQSGALSESLADVFGTMAEFSARPASANWLIGEDITMTGAYCHGTLALRSLSNPAQCDQPAHVEGFNVLPGDVFNDNGGVHVNSGIPNKAFYDLATYIGRAKAERIFYRSMLYYITPSATFDQMRSFTTQACNDIYGALSGDCLAVRMAFANVGLTTSIVQSSHPYANNTDVSWTITNPDVAATASRVHFSAVATEAGYDFIYVYDSSGTLYETISAASSGGAGRWSGDVPGRTVRIRLVTDNSISAWGFTVDQIASVPAATYLVTVAVDPPGAGSVTPAGASYGGLAIFTAVPNAGYYFYDWEVNGVRGTRTNPLTIYIGQATTLTAHFISRASFANTMNAPMLRKP